MEIRNQKGRQTDLFLFHKLRIGHIVDNVLPKYGRRQDGIDLFSVDIFELAI